jgi:hypothetical protein
MSILDFAKKEEQSQGFIYTEDQLMARLKFFIGICLSLTLTGIVFVVLYSLIFVTQPLNAISPIDQKFFELIVPIATFLTGTLSGIMLAGNDKEAQKMAMQAANKGWDRPPTPPAPVMTTTTMTRTTGPMAQQGFNGTMASDFDYVNQQQSYTSQVVTGFGGKPAPVQPPFPEL